MMTSTFLYSPRLLLIASLVTLLQAELASTDQLAKLLNVNIPTDWPPGEYDQDAMQFFLNQLLTNGQEAAGWYSWYVIRYPIDTQPPILVANGGYFGPPDTTGQLEIGYSVLVDWRGQGIATELVSLLVSHAWRQEGVYRVIAHTLPTNQASIRVLTKNGFSPVKSNDQNRLCFEVLPVAQSMLC